MQHEFVHLKKVDNLTWSITFSFVIIIIIIIILVLL